MVDAAEEALAIAAGRSQSDWKRDRTPALAVMKDIEIIGEAASKLSAELREKETAIPWGDIIGMRNWLIHAYFDVSLEIVWETVERDLPVLLKELRRLLAGR